MKQIIGYIEKVSPEKKFKTVKGKEGRSMMMTFRNADETAFPQVFAFKCTGFDVNFAGLAGTDQLVMVELEWRCYDCKDKEGNLTFGNDIYAKSIKYYDNK